MKGLVNISLELLVTVSAMIGAEDLQLLGRAIWEYYLLAPECDSVVQVVSLHCSMVECAQTLSVLQACFLLMQFADKAPDLFTEVLNSDLRRYALSYLISSLVLSVIL
jgi:hypothetical protein